ncbi:DNA methyltransferase [Paenibacillus polymyxa]|uniref:DNA methyltransferase n=1 Tax=Paenibacillus polymyxa TaxID=1406 RepID=UPI0032AF0FBE
MTNKELQLQNDKRMIETDDFPFEFLSSLADKESWRKEIYRPVYHVHKWWAKRLGSVFRGIVLGVLKAPNTDLRKEFYKKQKFNGKVIYDPFMGSGTTIGESHKLGCIALGRDINPIACENVRVALGSINKEKLNEAIDIIEQAVGDQIRNLYKSKDRDGNECDVLYWFWVKEVDCPECNCPVDLFPSRIISKNAYPDRKPEIQVCCSGCDDIFAANVKDKIVKCKSCHLEFDPRIGNSKGAKATCTQCLHSFKVIDAIKSSNSIPSHRLYAKLVLTQKGEKQYLSVNSEDIEAYNSCQIQLEEKIKSNELKIPTTQITDGNNTNQVLKYNYTEWESFFNARQLLALGMIQKTIVDLTDGQERDLLLNVFSTVLEFNNMFASYKGEGTGAVRHMFSHHILKPEKVPIEANVWGTNKSSGAFSTLLKNKLNRLIEYRENPFEIDLKKGKHYDSSEPFSGNLTPNWDNINTSTRGIYLSCGSSDNTNLPSESVDFVVTDPPFFDNVHYSELADFFLSWQSLYPHGFIEEIQTTRHKNEVQDKDSETFSYKLENVFKECSRVLKNDGLMVFSYHHSRQEGWVSLGKALFESGFIVVNVHPVKAEMSSATPKSQSSEPIQLDIIIVCRKRNNFLEVGSERNDYVLNAFRKAKSKAKRLTSTGLSLSLGDCNVIAYSQLLSEVSHFTSIQIIEDHILGFEKNVSVLSKEIYEECNSVKQIAFDL